MPDFETVLHGRRSVRRFLRTPIPDSDLRALVEAAAWAPCAGRSQDWLMVACCEASRIQAAADAVASAWRRLAAGADGSGERPADYAGTFAWFGEAPVLIAVCAHKPPAWLHAAAGPAAARISGAQASAAMAAQNLLLAAEARGLGACILSAPVAAEHGLGVILDLPARHDLVALIALGHPDERPAAPPRPGLDGLLVIHR